MKFLSKKISLIAVVGLLFFGAGVCYYVWHKSSQTSNGTDSISEQQDDNKQPELPPEYATLDQIYTAYNQQKYAEVIKIAKEYAVNQKYARHLQANAMAMCLDAAIQVKDIESKEFCYKEEIKLLANEPDEKTKTEMIKIANELYDGTYSEPAVAGDENVNQ